MARTVWTIAEKKAIFARMEDYFRMHPNGGRKEALRHAQSVLNSSRWIVVTNQRVYNYKDRIDVARQNARKSVPEKATQAPAAIPAPTPAPERKESTTERLAQAFERLLDIMADAVAAKVAERISPQMSRAEFREHVDQQFEAEYAKRPKHDPRPVPRLADTPLPGVLVIGLLPAQAHSVSQAYKGELDLAFLGSEEAISRPATLRAHTVLMTKFISHAVQDKYRKAPQLHYCDGGITALVGVLDKIVAPVL